MEGSFNYLGDLLLKDQLFDFAELIRDNFPGTVAQNSKLSEKLDALSNRANTWPSEVGNVYREREAPLYNSEDIVKLNNQNSAEILQVNGTRAEQKKTFQDQIDAYKVQIQQSHSQLETRLAGYRKELANIDASLNM
jgi:cell division septum initiation protein DivIVA